MKEGSVSAQVWTTDVDGRPKLVQTWLPGHAHYQEVVRRNNDPSARWALVTLDENDEPDDQGAIPVSLG